ncbi:MAG TPA: peptide chain release factor N(5)-glutamine methyltransferase [Anaerolineales bacterium]|nr:peptide chain release factor N(5)-glutamine methyltransferase [Anaerolineales bacterium]
MTALLSDITTRLTSVSDTPALDASVVLAHILGKPRTWVLAHPDLELTPEQKAELKEKVRRLESGEPLPYVLGHWEFFGMEFDLSPAVLIPRPETELLVEKAIAWVQASPTRRKIADVGTGSGIIAIAIAVHVPEAVLLATDISAEALSIARKNAVRFHVQDRIEFVQCNLLPAQPLHRLDLLCANLPYIPTSTLQGLPVYGREPGLALDGGADGLELIRSLLDQAPDWIAPGGRILLEIESTLGPQTLQLAQKKFPQADIRLHRDLTGHDRLVEISLT